MVDRKVGVAQTYATIALAYAAANSGDTITVMDAVHSEYGIALNAAKNVTVRGLGYANTIVQNTSGTASRIFIVTAGIVNFEDMSIGYGGGGLTGGAIDYAATATPGGHVDRCFITQCRLSVSNVGSITVKCADVIISDTIVCNNTSIYTHSSNNSTSGIWVNADGCQIIRCSVYNNTCPGSGAGVCYVSGTSLVITDSFIYGNSVTRALKRGGGIYVSFAGSSLTVSGTTISANTAAYEGGGVFTGSDCVGVFSNCTISGNSATAAGGASLYSTSNTTFYNCTISDNTCTDAASGGIHRVSGVSTVALDSTIASGNTANAVNIDIYGEALCNYSLIQGLKGAGGWLEKAGSSNNVEGVSPALAALADNGGIALLDGTRVYTRLIANTSPAYDTGRNTLALTTDQRGAGYDRTRHSITDIGAFEVQTPATFTVTITPGANGSTNPTGATVVASGGNLSIDIYPDVGYEIASILLDGAVQTIANPFVILNVTADHAVDIAFSKLHYTISISPSTGGTVTPSGSVTVEHGDNLPISIVASTGYRLFFISDNGAQQTLASTYTLTSITGNHTIVVGFMIDGVGKMVVRIGQSAVYDATNVASSYQLQQVLSSGQKLVILGEGTYNLDASIVIPAGITVRGDGQGVTILKWNSSLSVANMIDMAAGSSLESLTVQQGTVGTVTNLVRAATDNCVVRDVYFNLGRGYISGGYCKVTDCEFYGSSIGLYVSGSHSVVTANIFTSCVQSLVLENSSCSMVKTNNITGNALSTYGIRLIGTSEFCLIGFNQIGAILNNGVGLDINTSGQSNQVVSNIFFGAFGTTGNVLVVSATTPSTNQFIGNQSNMVTPVGARVVSADLQSLAAIGNL